MAGRELQYRLHYILWPIHNLPSSQMHFFFHSGGKIRGKGMQTWIGKPPNLNVTLRRKTWDWLKLWEETSTKCEKIFIYAHHQHRIKEKSFSLFIYETERKVKKKWDRKREKKRCGCAMAFVYVAWVRKRRCVWVRVRDAFVRVCVDVCCCVFEPGLNACVCVWASVMSGNVSIFV